VTLLIIDIVSGGALVADRQPLTPRAAVVVVGLTLQDLALPVLPGGMLPLTRVSLG
jgi:hypothetical protein